MKTLQEQILSIAQFLRYILLVIIMCITLTSDGQKKQWEREGVIYVPEVSIRNKALADFIVERVFMIADSVLKPRSPYIRYEIRFKKTPWIKSCDNAYHVTIGAYAEPHKFPDFGFDQSFERGYLHNTYVTFINNKKSESIRTLIILILGSKIKKFVLNKGRH